MTVPTYTERQTIQFYSTNSTKDMNLSALFNIILAVSEHQLHAAGIDSQQMVARGFGWVVTKYHLEVTRFPQLDEQIIITTTADSYNKFFCYRSFIVQDTANNELLRLTSNWIMLRIQDRKMVSIDPEIMAQLGCPYSANIQRFPRLDIVEYPVEAKTYRTRFFDIDVNGHVNNSIYLDWMLDALSMEFLRTHQIATLDIKYDREVQYGDIVQSKCLLDDNISHHQIESNTGANAQAQIKWQDRK
ncbi:acyl-[acyl-carrier-protein] thioesterase [Bombilactobacillus thymidiniphilus]|uniref:Thioesterase n=1 Tax=Bombilactobacillus thymidiniphilus TaxID=2923363 RepID=A0ABY4PDZ6_9LACO|nr:acyl-ACP thioesterase domain-containing protein [Bombilactobacillus thymidiniphilus]UQS83927.1 thioesterase [Bombilactobacillus thymidiniphilus]